MRYPQLWSGAPLFCPVYAYSSNVYKCDPKTTLNLSIKENLKNKKKYKLSLRGGGLYLHSVPSLRQIGHMTTETSSTEL